MTSATRTERRSPNRSARGEHRVTFIGVHWTGGSYASAVDWCLRYESYVSYHRIIGPRGESVQLVDWDKAAWANGWCKSPDVRIPFTQANKSSDNVALAGAPPVPPTAAAVAELVDTLVERMIARAFAADETWRILGHDQIAIYPADYHVKALRGQYGRKPDPQGSNWLPLDPVRAAVAARLRGG